MKKKQYVMIASIMSVAVAAGIFYTYGTCFKAALYTAAAVCLAVIAAEDAATRQIHDVLLLSVALLGACDLAYDMSFFMDHASDAAGVIAKGAGSACVPAVAGRIAGAVSISVPMIIVNMISRRVTGNTSFGSGDVILCSVCGVLFGVDKTVSACALAFIGAGIYAAFLLLSGRADKRDVFAFGPFLCAGFIISVF
jgi:prepilin signal peptidase PulO-like enzyme (type II secretory pathway)